MRGNAILDQEDMDVGDLDAIQDYLDSVRKYWFAGRYDTLAAEEQLDAERLRLPDPKAAAQVEQELVEAMDRAQRFLRNLSRSEEAVALLDDGFVRYCAGLGLSRRDADEIERLHHERQRRQKSSEREPSDDDAASETPDPNSQPGTRRQGGVNGVRQGGQRPPTGSRAGDATRSPSAAQKRPPTQRRQGEGTAAAGDRAAAGAAPATGRSRPRRAIPRRRILAVCLLLLVAGLGYVYAFHEVTFGLDGRPAIDWKGRPSLDLGLYQNVRSGWREVCDHCGVLLDARSETIRVPYAEAAAFGVTTRRGSCESCLNEVVSYTTSHQCTECERHYIVHTHRAPRREVPQDTVVPGVCSSCRSR